MHELALAEAIADTVSRRAPGRTVRKVAVRIGHLRQVVPDALHFSWEMLTDGTDLAGCFLEIEHVPAAIVCRECGAGATLQLPVLICPSCEGADVELVSGEEFLVATLDVVPVATPSPAIEAR